MNYSEQKLRLLITQSEADTASEWCDTFANAKSRAERTGVFVGREFLRELLDRLDDKINDGAEPFDGIQITYALKNRKKGEPSSTKYPTFELVISEVNLEPIPNAKPHSPFKHRISREGCMYTTVPKPSTEPIILTSPPVSRSK